MKKPFFLITALIVVLVSAAVRAQVFHGPSFDCRKATSVPERLICADAELSRMDRELADLYRKAKAIAADSMEFQITSTREWRIREQTCKDRECLVQWFERRRLQLANTTGSPSYPPADPQRNQADPLVAGTLAQLELLQTQRGHKAFEEAIEATKRRFTQRSADHTKRLYLAAKAAGIRMAPVAAQLAAINVDRRTSGVWELRVDQQLDGPYLVTVLDFMDRDVTFAVEGKGTYSVRGYLRDPGFEKSGKFAEECKYQIYVGQQSKYYPCAPYLNGELDRQVEIDLKELLVADIKR